MKSKIAVEKTTQAAERPKEKPDLVRDQEPSTTDTVADLRLSGNISANPGKIISFITVRKMVPRKGEKSKRERESSTNSNT